MPAPPPPYPVTLIDSIWVVVLRQVPQHIPLRATHLDGVHVAVHGVQAQLDFAKGAPPKGLHNHVLVDAGRAYKVGVTHIESGVAGDSKDMR